MNQFAMANQQNGRDLFGNPLLNNLLHNENNQQPKTDAQMNMANNSFMFTMMQNPNNFGSMMNNQSNFAGNFSQQMKTMPELNHKKLVPQTETKATSESNNSNEAFMKEF